METVREIVYGEENGMGLYGAWLESEERLHFLALAMFDWQDNIGHAQYEIISVLFHIVRCAEIQESRAIAKKTAMRHIDYRCPEKFLESLATPMAIFLEIVNGLLL